MATPKKWELDRRTFLRGAGASIALPLLEAMLPSIARAQTAAPKRLLWIYIPNGLPLSFKDNGLYNLPQELINTLTPIRSETSLLQNLCIHPGGAWKSSGVLQSAHRESFEPFINNGAWASPVGRASGMGKTFDQYIADVNKGSRLATVSALAYYEDVNFQSSDGYTAAQAHTMSYRGPDQGLIGQSNPKALFDQLFIGATTTPGTGPSPEVIQRKRNILHYVMSDITRINKLVGIDDKRRIDEYLTGISELDRKIASLTSMPTTMTCEAPSSSTAANYQTRIQLMYDIIYYAFKCDLTRVATHMHAMEESHMYPSTMGITGMHSGAYWHGLSHWSTTNYQDSSGSAEENRADILKVLTWHYTQIANFVKRMKDTTLPNGKTMLDESAVLWGSCLGDGASHDPRGLQFCLAGTAGGTLKKGLTLDFQNGQMMANLYLTLMQAFGVNANKIGQSTGPISALRAS